MVKGYLDKTNMSDTAQLRNKFALPDIPASITRQAINIGRKNKRDRQ